MALANSVWTHLAQALSTSAASWAIWRPAHTASPCLRGSLTAHAAQNSAQNLRPAALPSLCSMIVYGVFNSFPDYSDLESWEGTLKGMASTCCCTAQLESATTGGGG